MITEQAKLFSDYNTLPADRNYRISGMKFFSKDSDIVRMEISYLFGSSGEVMKSIQPEQSEAVTTATDVKVVDINLLRTETIIEMSGLHDNSHITYLRIRTSQHKDYIIGVPKISVHLKELKFDI